MRRIIVWAIVVILVGASVAYVYITENQSSNSALAKCQSEEAKGYNLEPPVVSPTIFVQFGTTTGVFSVKIGGSQCSPITGLTINSIRPFVNGVVGTSFIMYNGGLVGPSNPVPLNEPASGWMTVSNVSVGQTYSFNYTLTVEAPGWGSSGTITLTAVGYTPISFSLDQNLDQAANHLVANYNSKLGLIPETPGSQVYWLYSDNYLADLALAQYVGNQTMPHTAANISQSIERYLPVPDLESQYAVLGSNRACSFPTPQNSTLHTSGVATIKTVLNNGDGLLNDMDYADIAFLDAICQANHGNATAFMTAYDTGAKMFNGTGLVDKAFTDPTSNSSHQYQTYKLALYVYASVRLDQPINVTALSILLKMEDPVSGGFYTGYYAGYLHGTTLTNTETTSLALLALESVESQEPP